MIKYNLKALILDKEFKEDTRITYKQVSEATGISKPTLSKIASKKGYNTTTENVEKLCRYFKVTPEKLMTLIPDITGQRL